jgi:hypothetical protein
MSIDDKMTIERVMRENKMLRACLQEHDRKEANAALAAMEAKRAEKKAAAVIREVQLADTELEERRISVWWLYELNKMVADGRG